MVCSKTPPGADICLDQLLDAVVDESRFYSARFGRSRNRETPGKALSAVPMTTVDELIRAKQETGDAYSGRLAGRRHALATFQLDYAEGSLYQAFDEAELNQYAEALRRCLLLLGVERGDAIALFDFGTSPAVYLASACYTPYLSQGAADALGCTVVCNDGVANVSQRGVEILKHVRPRYAIVRTDCFQPLLAACKAQGLDPALYTRAFVVTYNEGWLDRPRYASWQQELGLPIYQLARSDLALFMALHCPQCHLLHTWSDLYVVEVVSDERLDPVDAGEAGRLVITSRFARCCPAIRVLTQLRGRLVEGGCPAGPGETRVCLS